MSVKIGKYEYSKSTRPNKKLMVKVNNKWIHFGDAKMQQFKDRTGIWEMTNHHDPIRRKKYLARAKGIKDKDGNLTWKDPNSANFHSVHILW